MTPHHHARLVAAGADPEMLASLDLRRHTAEALEPWWAERGNALYVAADIEPPRDSLLAGMTDGPVSDALIVVASETERLGAINVDGDNVTILIGPDCEITAGTLYCGTNSSIVLNGGVTGTWCATLDARNGGTIVAEADQLWATNVYIATDDMHRLEDLETGARLNPFGAHIKLGRHVWLGRDAIVTGHAVIGDGAVVGMRSLVRGQKIAPNTAVAGTPARVIRERVTWNIEDVP